MENAKPETRPQLGEARGFDYSPAGRRNLILGLEERRAMKREGMAAAAAWRESRRCPRCRAFAFESCAHRPNGAHGELIPTPAVEHMPFAGHRTCKQVREDQERAEILRGLGR